ncbi:hypothetical protein C4569_02960 [Candidatus Parcubacteria bacterium]|nr:MAG: hypothetical protein C4569_02960 [Candidatus Parcubacteria bacterium]
MPAQNDVYGILKITYIILPLLAGLDKFFNFLVPWQIYLSPQIRTFLPLPAPTFMIFVGIIEILAAVLVWRKTQIGAYVVAVWLFLVALNLIVLGAYDIAVRDLVISIGAYCLGRLAYNYKTDAV